jgi:hypothetical protein
LTANNRSNLYLYLALVCFVGILAIFVVDGYLGVYDTAYIKFGEREQIIEAYSWQEQWVKEQGYSVGTSWGEAISFNYKIDNRTFSTYEADVDASVWKSGVKIIQLLDEHILVPPFEEVTVDWILQTDDLGEIGLEAGQAREYTVIINLGDVQRKIVVSYYVPVPGYPDKGTMPIPAPGLVR